MGYSKVIPKFGLVCKEINIFPRPAPPYTCTIFPSINLNLLSQCFQISNAPWATESSFMIEPADLNSIFLYKIANDANSTLSQISYTST